MRKLASIIGFLLICVAWSSVSGQTPSPQKPNELAQTVSDAYKEKKLADLDKKHLAAGTITVVIEHSLMEGKNGKGLMKVRQFKSLAAIDKWRVPCTWKPSQENIFRDGEIWKEVQLLMNEGNPAAGSVLRVLGRIL